MTDKPHPTFETWWDTYPHKVAKRAALKAYSAAIKRGASPADLIEGIRRYIATKPSWQAYCYPATWLNGDRYQDEPAQEVMTHVSRSTTNAPDWFAAAGEFTRDHCGGSDGSRRPAHRGTGDLFDTRH
jgi:hypothetical protein